MAPLKPPLRRPPPPPSLKPPTFQCFESEDGELLPQTIAYTRLERDRQCILWEDVQRVFPGVDYLKITREEISRAPFMVNKDGELFQPLCIRCEPAYPYRVVYRHQQRNQRPELEFEQLYHAWMEVSKYVEYETADADFQGRAANVRYHYSKVLDQLTVLKEIGVRAKVDGKTEGHILTELEECRIKMASWDYEAACRHVLQTSADYPLPFRFVVFPSDLGSWDDSNPATHNFRLRFLCDIEGDVRIQSALPRHKHLSNHPGYDLVRPHEFFQKYGSYALTILKMVRQGFSHNRYEITPLETFNIFWGCDLDGSDNFPTKGNIESLVNKSIGYLEGLYLPRRSPILLTEKESIAIKDFLAVPDGSNTLGGLYRYTEYNNNWFWYCKQHAHHQLSPGALDMLMDFVLNCSGQVDMQLATIRIELHSRSQANQFWTLLSETKPVIHSISLILSWKDASRQDMIDILQKAADARVYHLELAGVPYDTFPKGAVENRTDIFVSLLHKHMVLKALTLLNCPRPQEQYTYFNVPVSTVLRLHSEQQQQVETRHGWNDRWAKIKHFVQTYDMKEILEASRHLRDFLIQDGHQAVSMISHHQSTWCGEFDLGRGVFRELQVYDLLAFDENSNRVMMKPVILEALGSLHTLTVDVDDFDTDQVVTRVVEASPQLQDLLISIPESRTLERVEKTLQMWQGRSNTLQLTLLERDNCGQGHVVAQVLIRGHTSHSLAGHIGNLQEVNTHLTGFHGRKLDTPTKAEFLQWNYERVSEPLADLTIPLIDIATEQHLTVLTSFVLDISGLSQDGLFHVQNILQRSMLSHLQIRCTAFAPSLTVFICHVLLVVQWSTLQSLILSDSAVNEWIQLLATTTEISLLDLQLQSFRIQGSGSQPVCLTHSSVLFVHQLINSNPLMEVVLESVYLQDERDTDLIQVSPPK